MREIMSLQEIMKSKATGGIREWFKRRKNRQQWEKEVYEKLLEKIKLTPPINNVIK